ncbi:MAG: MMPL family transporter [Dehalococcoidia bacterium]
MSPSNGESPSIFERWASVAQRRRWVIIAAWAALIVVFGFLAGRYGSSFATNFRLPGSETLRAQEILEERFPARAGAPADLVFRSDAGVADPATRARVEVLIAEISQIPGVTGVSNPYDGRPGFVSPLGHIARAEIQFSTAAREIPSGSVHDLIHMVEEAGGDGVVFETGGEAVQANEQPAPGSEFIGLAIATVVLLAAFGSVVAAGVPIVAALAALGVGVSLVTLWTRVWDFPEFSPQFMAMIGIGVGIDYSLLVVTRFREGLHTGCTPAEALTVAVNTSGRSVFFAGAVVAVSFLGLFAMQMPFVAAMGTAGAVVVLLAVLVALTLVPALLAIIGSRIDRWHIPLPGGPTTDDPNRTTVWYRLSEAIRRRPIAYFAGSTALLLFLAIPVLHIHLGFTDSGNRPESSPSRRAYDLLAEGFGSGFNGPLLLVAELDGATLERAQARVAGIAGDPGIAAIGPLVPGPAGDAAVVQIIPKTSPQDSETVDIVERLRTELATQTEVEPGLSFYMTGLTAALVDSSNHIQSRLPYLFFGVIGLSVLLLMAVFRSIVIALKAAVMNLLSIGASYGVLVAVFQWGYFGDIIGIEKGPIEPFLPMMLFAILFGLSMDYEVFLISRVREEYLITKENGAAVSRGLAATARVISAAAAIMVAVFLAFVLGPDRIVKEFGMGLATAIFVDATIVRLILVPSAMELLGEANWWFPRWLDRIVPNFHLEVPPAEHEPSMTEVPASGGGR